MKKMILLLAVGILLLRPYNPINAQVQIEPAFPNLSFEQPIDIQNAGDGTNRLYVVSQPGKIFVFDNNTNTSDKKVFLDLTNKVLYGGEQGLLGLAFHPEYKTNGFFFVNYTTNNPRRSIVSRFTVSSSPEIADENSELVLLEIEQPYSNHNGGQISFGPDGYLYISFGDGGSGGDPQNNGQNLKTLLGKILRIDINSKSGSLDYSIPADNPFKGDTNGLREEIYAWGLRNVWRFSFDKLTNALWAADVGQNLWEEINIIENGKNYGWRITEGNHCYNPSSGCSTTNLTMPIWEYGHNQQGGYSVTGGFIYRGNNAKELTGKYIYADFVTGNIWALNYENGQLSNSLITQTNHSISTFGTDQDNELYFANYVSGKIYKFKGTPISGLGMNTLPEKYNLLQNYPNPFNPDTTIVYHLPAPGHILLKVYDMLGKELVTLVDEYKQHGTYEVKFSAFKKPVMLISSGIFVYVINAGNYVESKKMVFLK